MQAIVDGTLAVRLFQGCVSRNSILCVRFAQKGFTGPKNFLEGPWGYSHLYSKDQFDSGVLVEELGRRFELNKTVFKSYPSCGATIASTDAILSLIKERGIAPESVARIDIRVLPYCYRLVGGEFEAGDNPTVNAKFSIQYCVANALLRRGSRLEHFEEESIRDPRIMELVKKIHITADPTIDSGRREYSLRTDMKVTTVKGDVYQKIVDIPSGFPGNAMSAEEHIDRFWDAATYKGKRLPEEKIEKIIDTVRHLEAAKDIRSLIPLLSR